VQTGLAACVLPQDDARVFVHTGTVFPCFASLTVPGRGLSLNLKRYLAELNVKKRRDAAEGMTRLLNCGTGSVEWDSDLGQLVI
jgi:hypothetical protein